MDAKLRRPMLAGKTDLIGLKDLKYPVMVSPKLDGVRARVIDGKLMSRKHKRLPNKFAQKLLEHADLNGLDGELIVGSPTNKDCYRTTMSLINSRDEKPTDGAPLIFHVFDSYSPTLPFSERHKLTELYDYEGVKSVPHIWCYDYLEVLAAEENWVSDGYEGIMIRDPNGPYKHGRSTSTEGWLLKLKRFEDSEAMILEVLEEKENTNEQKTSALGYAKRTSHKANKVGKGIAGALRVKDTKTGVIFKVGSGIDDEMGAWLWASRSLLVKRKALIKYKFQAVGVKDKPRFPTFEGMRAKWDI